MLGDLIGGLVGGIFGTELYDRRRRRRLARADAAGLPLELPGSVLGTPRYCHPSGGMLRIDGATLTWLTDRGGKSYPVPVERLAARSLADVPVKESYPGGRCVAVVCDDAGTVVRLVVLEDDLGYLARVVPGLRPVLDARERRMPRGGAAWRRD
ncbi:hypothetical protein [Cellulomonas sp. HZM]|uniref:hypothetical protein n=1 Tax=Cellulomonas sp. HZM TaxID=1454010 RepID=UPI000A4841F3|nr:hypothetical protein [Cellulomonas sp. HZM]